MKVCFVYDRVNKVGGAERVLTELHSIWPNAPLYTAVYDAKKAVWANDFHVVPSFLQRIPGFSTHHEYLANLMPYAFESLDLSQFDVVISITSAEAKGVLTMPRQLHICYLLTPTRYLWSHSNEYATKYAGPGPTGSIRKWGMSILRNWDLVASSRPDKIVAISQEVANRTKRFYHRSADAVIYPPVRVSFFNHHKQTCFHPDPGYFLIVSRLVPYKQVELAIHACNCLKERLVIVGTGYEQNRLKKMSGPTIEFKGQISDEELNCLYHHAKAFLFPQQEEFGISAVEAQAAGLPVIAYRQGSASEIVNENVTGVFFDTQTPEALIAAIQTWKNHTWYDTTSKEQAARFDQRVFTHTFKQYVEDAWKQHNQE